MAEVVGNGALGVGKPGRGAEPADGFGFAGARGADELLGALARLLEIDG